MFYFLFFAISLITLILIGLSISGNPSYGFWVVYPIAYLLIFWFLIITIDSTKWLNRLFIIILIPFLGFIAAKSTILTQERMESKRYVKAELALVEEWYSQNAKDGELMVLSEPIALYYADQSNFVPLRSFAASSQESFISELQKKGATYVVWNSTHGELPNDSYYYKTFKVFLISELEDGKDKPHFKLTKTIRIGPEYAFVYKFVP